jgi:hypothetical protein
VLSAVARIWERKDSIVKKGRSSEKRKNGDKERYERHR